MITVDNLVIGGDFRALLYAAKNGYHILYTHKLIPHKREHFYAKPGILNYRDSCMKNWLHYNFLLELSGQLLFGDKIKSVKVNEKTNIVKVFSNFTKLGDIKVRGTIYVFDLHEVTGIKAETLSQRKFKVLDWFEVHCCQSHGWKCIRTEDNFVKEIRFYIPKDRVSMAIRNKIRWKDFFTVSYLTKDELNSSEFTPTYVTSKVLSVFQEKGIKGKKDGRRYNFPKDSPHYGEQKRMRLRIEHVKRDVDEINTKIFEDTDRIKFVDMRLDDIVLLPWKDSYYTRVIKDEIERTFKRIMEKRVENKFYTYKSNTFYCWYNTDSRETIKF